MRLKSFHMLLDRFNPINICVAYELDGRRVSDFPGSAAMLERCSPIYEEVPGWEGPTAGVTKLDDLPTGARFYIDRLEDLVGLPIDIISTGPLRHETITVRNVI